MNFGFLTLSSPEIKVLELSNGLDQPVKTL